MDAVFIFIYLGLTYIINNYKLKGQNLIQTKLNPDKIKKDHVYQDLFDYLMSKKEL